MNVEGGLGEIAEMVFRNEESVMKSLLKVALMSADA